MSFDSDGLVLNSIKDEAGTYKTIFDVQVDGKSQLYIDNQGNLVIANETIQASESVVQLGSDISKINGQINVLKQDVSSLGTRTGSLETKTGTLESNYSTLNKDVNSLEDDVSGLDVSVTSLNTSVSNIATIMSGSAGTGALKKINLTSKNTTIENGLIVDAMVASNAAIQSTKIKHGNTTVSAVLDSYSNSLSDINSAIEDLQEQIDNIGDIGGGTDSGNGGTAITNVDASDVTYQNGTVKSTVQKALDDHKGQINTLDTEVKNINNKIQDVVLNPELITIADIDAICSQ